MIVMCRGKVQYTELFSISHSWVLIMRDYVIWEEFSSQKFGDEVVYAFSEYFLGDCSVSGSALDPKTRSLPVGSSRRHGF